MRCDCYKSRQTERNNLCQHSDKNRNNVLNLYREDYQHTLPITNTIYDNIKTLGNN